MKWHQLCKMGTFKDVRFCICGSFKNLTQQSWVSWNPVETFPWIPLPGDYPSKHNQWIQDLLHLTEIAPEEQLMNPRTVWVRKDLKDHLVPTLLSWAGNSDRQAAESKEWIKFFPSLLIPSKEQALDSLKVGNFCKGPSEDSFLSAVCFPYFHISRCVIFENIYDERNCLEITDWKQIPSS